MLTLIDLRGYDGDPASALSRASLDRASARASVAEIVAAVRDRGDDAVREITARFAGSDTEPRRVGEDEIAGAHARCEPGLVDALKTAADRIRAYHEYQLSEERAAWWRIGGSRFASARRRGRSVVLGATSPAAGPRTRRAC